MDLAKTRTGIDSAGIANTNLKLTARMTYCRLRLNENIVAHLKADPKTVLRCFMYCH